MSNKNHITVSEDDLLASIDNETITLSDWTSPLSVTPSTSIYPTSSLGTARATVTTTTGAGNLSWNNPTWTTTAAATQVPSIMKVERDAEFHGEVKIRGVKLDERLNAIEERLGILRPNNDLEGKWEKLKAIGEEYRRLEKEILEGEDIWATLKK